MQPLGRGRRGSKVAAAVERLQQQARALDGDELDGHVLSRAELWQELRLQQRCVVALEEALQAAEHRSALLERAGGQC